MPIIENECPGGPLFDQLVNRIGKREAVGVWMEHRLAGTTFDPMQYPKPRFPGDFEHVWHEPFDGIKDYTAMAARKKELEATGARVSVQGNGLRVSVSPVGEQLSKVYYQKADKPNEVKSLPKSVEVAETPKAKQEWGKLHKGNISFQQFLDNSQFPKEQKALLQEIYNEEHPKTLPDLITSLVAKYSYTVEINTAKSKQIEAIAENSSNWFNAPYEEKEVEYNTSHYSNLTVPGGQNYTENDIVTPQISPSIQSHAAFANKDNSIGWFRSDDLVKGGKYYQGGVFEGEMIGSTTDGGEITKTRRILELQSDAFQKGRDKEVLTNTQLNKFTPISREEYNSADIRKSNRDISTGTGYESVTYEDDAHYYMKIEDSTYGKVLKSEVDKPNTQNQFLQLLNKDGNWIPFFIKSIVQDSAKKGYEKVLFPTGDSASKIEGHETLEGFRKQQQDAIGIREKEIERIRKSPAKNSNPEVDRTNIEAYQKEIEQFKEELKRVYSEGFAALKPIYDFYENRVGNTLRKIYGKDKVERIKDEYGNEWYQVDIEPTRDLSTVYYQKGKNKGELPNEQLDKQVKGFLKSIGFAVRHKPDGAYAGLADTYNKVIEVVDSKADMTTLGHEATHALLDLLPDNSPIWKEIFRDVITRREYVDVYEQYKDDPEYKSTNGKVDEDKMAREAAAHIIDKIIVDKFKEKAALKWWEKLWKWIVSKFKGKNLNAYEQVAEDILGNNISRLDINKVGKGKYKQLSKEDKERVNKVKDQPSTSEKQRAIIEGLYMKEGISEEMQKYLSDLGLRPSPKVELDDATHVYKDKDGIVYDSTTRKITGEFSADKAAQYEINKDIGNDIDALLQAAILGKSFKDIEKLPTTTLPDDYKNRIYGDMLQLLDQVTDNSIALTQVIVSDPISKTAGSIDLMVIDTNGNARVYDLKSSVNEVKGGTSDTYLSEWQQNRGSVFNGLTYKDGQLVPRQQGDEPVKLSKKLQHAIQTGAYARMLELQGVPVVGLYSYHVKVDIDHVNNTLKSYKVEGVVPHSIEDNKPYIDQVVPTQVDINNLSELQKQRAGYDYIPETDSELEQMANNGEKSDTEPQPFADIPAIKSLSEAIQKFIGEKIEYLKRLKLTKSDKVHIIKDDEILNLEQLQVSIGASISKENYSSALEAYMDYTINQANNIINYADNRIHIDGKLNENYLDVMTRGKSFLEGYRDINSMVTAINANQVPKFSESVSTLNDLEDAINEGLIEYMIEYTVAQGFQYTREEIEEAIRGGAQDIGVLMGLFAGASASKSVLVSLAFSEVRKGVFTAFDESAGDKRVIDRITDELKVVSPGTTDKNRTDFMINRNDMSFVQRVGPEYDRMKDAAKQALTNPDTRERYEFVPGDERFNKELFAKIQDYGDLTEAETFIPADYDPATNVYTPGYYEPAEYCEYAPVDIYDSDGNIIKTLDYVKQREIFEKINGKGKYENRYSPEDVVDLRWEKEGNKYYEVTKDGRGRQLSQAEVNSIAALQYRSTYKRAVPDKYTLEFKDGEFTGNVIANPEGQVKWVVKSEFKQVKNKSRSGKDLRDPKYVAIMSDNSPKGIAQRNYYTEYMGQRHLLSLKLPQVQRKSFMKYLDAIPTDELSIAYRTGGYKAIMELVKKKGNKFIVPTSKSQKDVVIDEKGDVMRSVPSPIRGRYDEQRVKELNTKLDTVKQELKSLSLSGDARKKKVAEQKDIQRKIKEESTKAKITDIDTDLSQSQKETADAVRLYDNKSKIESKLLTIKQIAEMKIDRKKIPLTDGENRNLFTKVLHGVTEGVRAMTDSGGMTNELTQINSILSMFQYMDDPYKDSVAAKIEGLPITLLSLRYFFLNPPIAFANAQMSRFLTTWPEAAVGEFFTVKQVKDGEIEVAKAQALWIKDRPAKLAGKGPKFSSKVEAVMYQHQLTPGSQIDVKTITTSLQHATEWTSMARYSIPIMKNMPIKGKDGTISNLYDIFKFNPNNGELTIDPNFKDEYESGNWKYKVYTRVFDFQSRFEGFYSNLERAAVTQYPFGRSAMFLKKHLPSFFIRLFSAPWVHHNLGYTEGTWRTLGYLVKDIHSYEGNIQTKMKLGMREVIPKGAIGNKQYWKLDQGQRRAADDKAYSEDKEFTNPDGTLNQQKVERDRQKRATKLFNLKRDLAQVVSILVFWAAYELFKALAQDDETDARRWNNYLARTFDKLRQQQMFGLPLFGLEEQYQLLKSPFASLRMIGDFGDTLNDAMGLAIPGVESRYTTGVHKGEVKAWVKTKKLVPVLNLEPWMDELNNPSYYRK